MNILRQSTFSQCPGFSKNMPIILRKKPLISEVFPKKSIRKSGFPNPKNIQVLHNAHTKKEVIGSIFGSLSVAKTFTKECPKLSKDPLWCWALYPLMKSPCNISHIDKTDAFI